MPANTLSLTLHKPAEIPGVHAWPVRVTAVSTVEGLSAKIFVHHAMAGATEFGGDVFECVASLGQMQSIPEDAPVPESIVSPGHGVPYYRKNVMEIVCLSPLEADELWSDIQEDAQELLNNYRMSLNFTETTTVDLS